MATLRWKTLRAVKPERQYVVLLSYLPLKQHRHLPRFLLQTRRIIRQLRQSQGVMGYSLKAQLSAKRFWTLSVWESDLALQRFVQAQPHAATMSGLSGKMGKTEFVRWTARGVELSVSWPAALERWRTARITALPKADK